MDKYDVCCDHCGKTITIDWNPIGEKRVFWCADCLVNGGRELLKAHGVDLSSDDKTYKEHGFTHWIIHTGKVGDWGEIVSKITKKHKPPPVPVDTIVAVVYEPSVVSSLPPVCWKRYNGEGDCSCGKCGGVGYVPNRNAFGYED